MSGYGRLQTDDVDEQEDVQLTDIRVDSEDRNDADTSLTGANDDTDEYPPGTLTLVVKTLTGQNFPICLTGGTPMVDELKAELQQSQGFPPSHQRLIFSGRELQDGNLLSSYNIKDNGTVVHLVLRRQDVEPQQPEQAAGDMNAQGLNMAAQFPQFDFHPGLGAAGGNPNVDYQRVHDVARLSAAVKIFSMIDGMLLLFLSLTFTWWPLFLGVLLCYAGYYGAQRLNHRYTAAYLVYILLSIVARIYLVAKEDSSSVIIFTLGIIIEMYIFRLCARFTKLISELTMEERNELSAMLHNPAIQGDMVPRGP